MRNIRNLKYIVPFMMSAMVACKKEPIPGPEPTPPTPPKPTTQTINVRTVLELEEATKTPAKDNNTIIINWTDDLFLTSQNNDKIGQSKDWDAARADAAINDNGHKVYYGGGAVVSNDDHVRDTKDHAVGPDKNGEWHFATGATDAVKWNNPNIVAQEIVNDIKVTAADAADYGYIARLRKEYPNKAEQVTLDFGKNPVNLMMEDLIHLQVPGFIENQTAQFIIKDGMIKIKDIRSKNPELSMGDDTNNTILWYLLSQRNGQTPTITRMIDKMPENSWDVLLVPINIVSTPANTFYDNYDFNTNGQNFIGVSSDLLERLPSRADVYLNEHNVWKDRIGFTYNCSKYAVFVSSDLTNTLGLVGNPETSTDVSGNNNKVLAWMRDGLKIVPTNLLSRMRSIQSYTSAEVSKKHPNVRPATMPEWARATQNTRGISQWYIKGKAR